MPNESGSVKRLAACGIAIWLLAVAPAPLAAQDTPIPLTLEEAVRLYLEQNLEIEATRLAVERTRAGQVAAGLRPNPGLTVTAENFRIAGPTRFDQIYEVAVAYSETIELGGKRRFRTALADLEVEVAEAALADRLRRGIAEVMRRYDAAVLALEKVDIAGRNLNAIDELVRYNTVRFEEGAIAESDLIKSRLEQVQFRTVLARRELDFQQEKVRLIELLGETDFDRRTVVGELAFDPIDVDVRVLRDATLENRPDVLAARLEVQRSRVSLDLERARGVPDLEPFVGYKRAAASDTLLFGVSIDVPFRQRNQGGIARAQSEVAIAEAQLRALEARVFAEVENAFAAYQTARRQVESFENDLLLQASESREIALVAYEEGATELLPLLEAQRTEAAIREAYFETLLSYRASLIDLGLATGTEVRP